MNIVIEVLERSIMDFWYRLFWFNDKNAKNVTDSGIITDCLDLKFFTIINGFWKQIITQATANPSQRGATITENAGASYAAQKLTPDKAKENIQSVVFSAPLLLRQQSDKFILVTQSVYDAYQQSLMDACCLESAR